MFTLAKLSLVNPENSVSSTRTTVNQPQGDDLPNAIANQNRNNSSNVSGEYANVEPKQNSTESLFADA